MVPFFSGSWPLAFNLSSKSQKITIYFIQKVFTKTKSFSLNTHFWLRKVVIWWLFNDDLRARGQEPEKKETTNFAPITKTFVIIFEQGDTIRLRETFGVLSHYSTQHFYWLDDDVKSSNLYICLLTQYIHYDSNIVYLATVKSGIDIAPWINLAPGTFVKNNNW